MKIARLPAVLAFASAAIACSGGPTSPPTPPVVAAASSYGGTWALEMTITDCSGLRHCWTRLGKPLSGWVRLIESGASLDGVLSLGYGTVDVTGHVAPDGQVALTGFTPPALADDPGGSELELRRFTANLSNGDGAGMIEFRQRGEFGAGLLNDYVIKATIIGVSRIAEAPAGLSFTGTWTGRLAVRSCRAVPAILNVPTAC